MSSDPTWALLGPPLNVDEEAKNPLIFGRPFLAILGAIVNVIERKINFHLDKGKILHFDIKKMMKKPYYSR